MSTIDKALDALFLLGNSPQPLRLSDVARALAMPRSSVHRILAPLVRRGLAEQDESGRYRVGFGLFALGHGVANREPLVIAAKPVLEAAAADLGETFFLVIARAGQLLVVEKAEGNGFMRAAPRLGAQVPVHATAVGKLYLAYAPDLVTPAEMTRFTSRTVRSQKALDRLIDEVRQQGWASNIEEWQDGLCVVAAPVFTGKRLVGAVALAMIANRFQAIGSAAATRRVRHAAEGIALRLEGKSA
jgi:IclR family transcriptional regulator, acetate operon repressor